MRQLGKIWLSCWLYVITAIAGILIGLTCANWSVWTMQTKLVALGTALLAFHVMYNLMEEDNIPDRYPMNQMSDMWTNFIGIIFGCFCLVIGVTPMLAVMQLLLCFGEMMAHISSGFHIKKMLQDKGKKTIYNPGLFTTLFGYLPIAIELVISFFTEAAPGFTDVILAIVCGGIMMGIELPGAEKVFKDKNTPYAYTWGHGYFEKYMK